MVEGRHTLTVIANDTGANVNQSQTITFVADRSGPVITIFNTLFNTSDTTPSFGFNFTDISYAANCTLYVNSNTNGTNTSVGNYTNANFTVAAALPEATYTASINCTDSSSRIGNASATLIVDISAPNANMLTTNGTKYSRNNNSAINVSILETNYVPVVVFQVANGSGGYFNLTPANNSGNWNLNLNASSLEEGEHNVTVIANDSAGNRNVSAIVRVVIDRTPPTISLSKHSSSTSSSLVITITTSADAGTCTSSRGSVSGSGSSQTVTAGGLNPDTSYSFDITCLDDQANSAVASGSFITDPAGAGGSSGGSGGSGGGSSSGSAASTGTSESTGESASSGTGSSNGGSGSGETSGESGDTQGTAAGQGSGSGDALAGQAFANGEGAVAAFNRIFVNLSWLWIIIVIVAGIVVGYYSYNKSSLPKRK